MSNAVNRTANRRILLSEMGYLESVLVRGNRRLIHPGTGSAQNHIKGRERCVMAQCSKVKEFRSDADLPGWPFGRYSGQAVPMEGRGRKKTTCARS